MWRGVDPAALGRVFRNFALDDCDRVVFKSPKSQTAKSQNHRIHLTPRRGRGDPGLNLRSRFGRLKPLLVAAAALPYDELQFLEQHCSQFRATGFQCLANRVLSAAARVGRRFQRPRPNRKA